MASEPALPRPTDVAEGTEGAGVAGQLGLQAGLEPVSYTHLTLPTKA